MARAKAAAASPSKAAAKSKTKSPRTKKAKKAKDPNAPKRGMSAYMLWLKDSRARITKPGMSVTDVSKAAGVEWNALKDKSKWEKAAAEDKKRYEKESAAYNKKK
ncbi:HMG (high mobility group) box domain-containing protein [Ditylenchus destructor]|uniref:HMG (High mobility group) box domain-containing protein n=1 Tax=Ditylenchus destructor TaxID=166010 RepID=A0AAD4N4F1_9BILA|nr:HMG (high mobility group) box domain-containing protein [Ditylenchus destructor]